MTSTNDTDLRAAIYARQSKGDESIGRQLQLCRERAAALGVPVVDEFTDRSVSASTRKPRPGYTAMMDLIKTGEANMIIVRHADRLYRQPRELEALIDATEGVRIEVVHAGHLDLDTASGRANARILGTMARLEVEMKSERQREAAWEAAQKGKARKGCPRPFGWQDDRITLNAAEAGAIRWAADYLLDHGGTVVGVVREWRSRGLRAAGRTSVTQILLNPRNAGIRTYQRKIVYGADGQPVTGEWQPILDRPTWQAVTDLLDDPARKPPRGAPTLLGGLAKCACGNPVVGTTSANIRDRHAYRCNPATRNGNPGPHCQQTASAVDALMRTRVCQLLSTERGDDLLSPVRPDLAPVRRERDAIWQRLRRIAQQNVLGEITDDEADAARAAARERLAQIDKTLDADAAASSLRPFHDLLASDIVEALEGALARFKRAREIWDGLDLAQRRAIIVRLFGEVTILPAGRGSRAFKPESVITIPRGGDADRLRRDADRLRRKAADRVRGLLVE